MEWKPEVNSWNTDNATSADALASSLRLSMPGFRSNQGADMFNFLGIGDDAGILHNVGIEGNYWYGSAVGSNDAAWFLHFTSSKVQPNLYTFRAIGQSVRCIKD
jgi:hypothetical protein